jgi:quinolinate synthase
LDLADYVGSTAEIIDFAIKSNYTEFIIGTEFGVTEHLEKLNPKKAFYPLTSTFECEDMKKIKLTDVLASLETGRHEMTLSEDEINAAKSSLERMVRI